MISPLRRNSNGPIPVPGTSPFNDRLRRARVKQNAEKVVLVRVTGGYSTQTLKYGRHPRCLGVKGWTFGLDAWALNYNLEN